VLDVRPGEEIDAELCRRGAGEKDCAGGEQPPRGAAPVAQRRCEDGGECGEKQRQRRLARQREIGEATRAEDHGEPVEAGALGKLTLELIAQSRRNFAEASNPTRRAGKPVRCGAFPVRLCRPGLSHAQPPGADRPQRAMLPQVQPHRHPAAAFSPGRQAYG
jgi:hypothetical protein